MILLKFTANLKQPRSKGLMNPFLHHSHLFGHCIGATRVKWSPCHGWWERWEFDCLSGPRWVCHCSVVHQCCGWWKLMSGVSADTPGLKGVLSHEGGSCSVWSSWYHFLSSLYIQPAHHSLKGEKPVNLWCYAKIVETRDFSCHPNFEKCLFIHLFFKWTL